MKRLMMIAIVLIAMVGCGGPRGAGGFLPDGGGGSATIAFVSREGATNHIRLMDVDASGIGSNPRPLTADAEAENRPAWSPDGRRLVYTRDLNESAVYVINADGTGEQRLSPTPGMDTTPSWSPDGTQIVYARFLALPQPGTPPQTDIRIINADGTGDHAILANTTFSIEPRWSVKGQIVFVNLMSGSLLDIYVMNADGSGLLRLTNDGARHGEPVWSPDGTKISFGSGRARFSRLDFRRGHERVPHEHAR